MLAPPQSLHLLLWRLCWQMLVPPQSLHLLLSRLCGQILVHPQSLHCFLCRLCAQMLAPPQSLQMLFSRPMRTLVSRLHNPLLPCPLLVFPSLLARDPARAICAPVKRTIIAWPGSREGRATAPAVITRQEDGSSLRPVLNVGDYRARRGLWLGYTRRRPGRTGPGTVGASETAGARWQPRGVSFQAPSSDRGRVVARCCC